MKKRKSKGSRLNWGYIRDEKPLRLSEMDVKPEKVDLSKQRISDFVDNFYAIYGRMMSQLSRE
jgi:hypothetical protein